MRSRTDLPSPRLSLVVLLVAILVVLAPRMADAASGHHTYFVAPSGSDATACAAGSQARPFATIQAALACSTNGDVIELAPSGAQPYPGIGTVAADIAIQAQPGADARTVTIDAGRGGLVVQPGADATLAGVTLTCPGSDCLAPSVTNQGSLTLATDTVTGNGSILGAIVNTTPANSTTAASLLISRTTVSGNQARFGAGVQSVAGAGATGPLTLTIANSTITGNFSESNGGGVGSTAATPGSSTTIVSSTITGNTAQNGGGGIFSSGPTTLTNTIVAANTVRAGTTPDCQSKTIVDGAGHNLLGDGTGCAGLTDAIDGDRIGAPRPGLLELADNGGPTDTIGLQAGSPALGGGDAGSCTAAPVWAIDQRGEVRRPGTAGCDIGAYDTGGAGGAVNRTYFVASGGSNATPCASNSMTSPFATIQAALACASDGDVIELAPSGVRPYPGIGSIGANVTVRAQPGADARTVVVDAGRGELAVQPGADAAVTGIALTCPENDCLATPTVTNEGRLMLTADSVTGNDSGQGAVVNTTPVNSTTPASLLLSGSTVSGNAARFGGGVASLAGSGASGALTLTIANSTITANYSQTVGGGIGISAATPGSNTQIVNSTITGNAAQSTGGGLYASGPTTISNTIIAANTARAGTNADCAGTTITDGTGHNLIGNSSGCPNLTPADNDQLGTASAPLDPLLAPLAYDGGPTETEPPLPASPALGTADGEACRSAIVLDIDQRGAPRRSAARGRCDLGAADSGGRPVKAAAPKLKLRAALAATEGSPLALTVTASGKPTPALSESGALPPGVSFHDNGDGTATLSGVPGAGSAGSYEITVSAGNGLGTPVSRTLVLTVAAGR